MEYTQFTFSLLDSKNSSILVAFLQLFNVESIWEDDSSVHAYFEDNQIKNYSGNFKEDLRNMVGHLVKDIVESKPKKINWNKEWESNFTTVEVDQFAFIYANFHEIRPGFQHYLEIAPKMAFGTGHHETTYMMIRSMAQIDLENKKILDLGCGTGILSVLASKMGASEIIAIDIEEPSFENTKEHADLNNVEIQTILGGVEDVPKETYDIVLANINRNVLLTYKDEIKAFVRKEGDLLLSGILHEDRQLIEDAYAGLKLEGIKNRGKWLCFHYTKGSSNL